MSYSDHSTFSGENSSSTFGKEAEPDSLPCLYSNNSITTPPKIAENSLILLGSEQKSAIQKMSTQHKKTASNLSFAVSELARRFGIEKLGFLTLTFKNNIIDSKEAQRRFNSFSNNVLTKRYKEYIRVYERQKRGAIHYHLLIVLSEDIRTGFDFDAIDKRNYSSACSYLRKEWSFLRKSTVTHGFGRSELHPVKSTSEGIARYVGKYISKGVQCRIPDDKGVRLVSYSKGAKIGSTRFSFVSLGSRKWRNKMKVFSQLVAERYDKPKIEYEDLKILLGSKWCWKYSDLIVLLPEKREELTWDIFSYYLDVLEKEKYDHIKIRAQLSVIINRTLAR